MAERKAVNKYYPPNWDPSKGSINKFVGQHPLRARAGKVSQGILTVRFEMPFDIFCLSCDNHIGMGVRYNAEKKKVGNYYTTPILLFKMKCHLCPGIIQIQTDPKNAIYVIISGARKREDAFSAKDAETIEFASEEEKLKLETDAFYKLEHGVQDKKKALETAPLLTRLQQSNDKLWRDPYSISQKLRKKFRNDKQIRVSQEKESQLIQDRNGIGFSILPANDDDIAEAKATFLRDKKSDTLDEKKRKIMSSSIFKKQIL